MICKNGKSLNWYCINDVEAEREIGKRLEAYTIPDFERINYILDQQINDRGILVDTDMAMNAYHIDELHSAVMSEQLTKLTGLDNPNSPAQLKQWLSLAMGKEITTLAKEDMDTLVEEAESEAVKEVLSLRKKSSKSSTKKYVAMLNCACHDNRVRGLVSILWSKPYWALGWSISAIAKFTSKPS